MRTIALRARNELIRNPQFSLAQINKILQKKYATSGISGQEYSIILQSALKKINYNYLHNESSKQQKSIIDYLKKL